MPTDPSAPGIPSVGVGECTVTAHQAGGNVIWTDAVPVSHTFEVLPAPLTITADDAVQDLRRPRPRAHRQIRRAVNGDTKAAIDGLVLPGPPPAPEAGRHPIVASGAAQPQLRHQLVDRHRDASPRLR